MHAQGNTERASSVSPVLSFRGVEQQQESGILSSEAPLASETSNFNSGSPQSSAISPRSTVDNHDYLQLLSVHSDISPRRRQHSFSDEHRVRKRIRLDDLSGTPCKLSFVTPY